MLAEEKKRYNRLYYEKHKERLRKRKKMLYQTDPTYREEVKRGERERYALTKLEKLFKNYVEDENAKEKERT